MRRPRRGRDCVQSFRNAREPRRARMSSRAQIAASSFALSADRNRVELRPLQRIGKLHRSLRSAMRNRVVDAARAVSQVAIPSTTPLDRCNPQQGLYDPQPNRARRPKGRRASFTLDQARDRRRARHKSGTNSTINPSAATDAPASMSPGRFSGNGKKARIRSPVRFSSPPASRSRSSSR